eukprot:45210_1
MRYVVAVYGSPNSAYSAYPSHPPPIMDKSHSIMLLQDTTAQIHTTTHMTDAAQIHSTNPHRWYHTHHYVSCKLDQLNLDFSCELDVELCEFKKAVVYYSLHQRRSVKEKRLAVSFLNRSEDQRECIMGQCKDECVCTMEYDPFCCDGTTYDNACQARCRGVDAPKYTCKKGSCESQACACPYVHQPICCNEENYPNSCTAKCVGIDVEKECKEGACEEELCTCTREFDPFCCDEKTYSNPCEARCDGHRFINFKCKAGICEGDEPCNCPQKHEPVCCNKGTD